MAYQILEKAKVGWQLGAIGFNVVKNNKEILIFHFLSSFLFIFTALLFIVPFIGASIIHGSFSNHWILGFFFLFTTITLSTWMKVSLCIYTNALFEQNPLGITASISRAASRIGAIAEWACADAIIGTIVKLVQRKKGRRELLESFIVHLGGIILQMSWNLLTFFVVPLLAFQKLPLIETIQTSGDILKKTWGESAGAAFSIGFIGIKWLLCWYLIFFGFFTLYCKYFLEHSPAPEKTLFLVILGIIAFFLPLFFMRTIISTVKVIVKTALFNYTQNKPTGPFASDLLKISFGPINTNQER